jgi:hypothetical protein
MISPSGSDGDPRTLETPSRTGQAMIHGWQESGDVLVVGGANEAESSSIRRGARDTPEQEDRRALQEMVKNSLREAERIASQLRKTNTRLVFAGISSSAACTLFAGLTAARGPLLREGPAGWRLACIISAILAFAATLCIGLDQQLRINDRLSTAYRCVGRLRSLEVIITTGGRSWQEVTSEYAEIEGAFPEYCEPRPTPSRLPLTPWPPPTQFSSGPSDPR